MSVYQYRLDHTAPELISLEFAKEHLKIESDFTEEDDLISSYIDMAIDSAAAFINADIYEAKIEYKASSFDAVCAMDKFKVYPVNAVESVKYIDENGGVQTVDTADYQLLPLDKYSSKLEFVPDYNYPATKQNTFNAVQVVLLLGYTAEKLPKPIKSAILLILGWMYENRTDKIDKMPKASERLLQKFKNYN